MSRPPFRFAVQATNASDAREWRETGGVGAIGRDGRLVDAALMRHAENVIRRAQS